MEMIHLCTDCAQVMTNPICPNCFSKHITSWLRDRKIPKKKMGSIRALLKKMVIEAAETPSDTECVICGGERVNVCTYCLTSRAQKIVVKNSGENVSKDFDEDFNTKIWTLGY